MAQDASVLWTNETFSEYCTDPVPHWTGGRAVQQRMIRADNWKFCLYDSEPPQLFDLENDPLETTNLAEMSIHHEVRDALMQKLTQDWNPQDIADRMKTRRIEKDILLEWAKNVQPVSSHVWTFSPGINRLE